MNNRITFVTRTLVSAYLDIDGYRADFRTYDTYFTFKLYWAQSVIAYPKSLFLVSLLIDNVLIGIIRNLY